MSLTIITHASPSVSLVFNFRLLENIAALQAIRLLLQLILVHLKHHTFQLVDHFLNTRPLARFLLRRFVGYAGQLFEDRLRRVALDAGVAVQQAADFTVALRSVAVLAVQNVLQNDSEAVNVAEAAQVVFGRREARSSGRLRGVFVFERGAAEVDQLAVDVVVQKDVSRCDVIVQDADLVQVEDGGGDLAGHAEVKLGVGGERSPVVGDEVAQGGAGVFLGQHRNFRAMTPPCDTKNFWNKL